MPTALGRNYAMLERQRTGLLERLAAYSDTQHAFQPDSACWSLSGVVQHLVLVEEIFIRHGRRHMGARPPTVTLRSRLKERMVVSVLGRDVRIRAPVATVVPRSHIPLALLGPRWRAARAELELYLEALPGPRWARTAFYHPRTDWITAAGGLRFLHAHTAHHLRQVDRILAAAHFPRAWRGGSATA